MVHTNLIRESNAGRSLQMLAVLRLMLMLAVIVAVRMLVPIDNSPAQAPLSILLESSAAIVALLLFAPEQRTLLAYVPWCVAVIALLLLVYAIDPRVPLLMGRIGPLLLVVLTMALTVAALTLYLAPKSVASLFIFLALAPVWAGPVLEALNNPAWLNRLVVGASPLTAMAVALDADYLRSPWFYEHSAIASMRYVYPDMTTVLAVLALLPVSVLLHQYNKQQPKRELTGDVSS